VDLIVTSEEVGRTPGGNRPSGILWDHLQPEKIDEIPILKARV
jgi:hypothetical protein